MSYPFFDKWVPGEIEAGVAEALLIGYRDDLDKDLVRSYSNTGVVHIIAISGLHLGMIYGLMLLILQPFRKRKWIRWVKPLLILFVLWGFSLLSRCCGFYFTIRCYVLLYRDR
jgi:competence protein ComEC